MSPRNSNKAEAPRQTVNVDELLEQTINTAKLVEGRVWGSLENPLNEGDYMVGTLVAVDRNVGEHGSTMLRFADPFGEEIVTWQRGTLKTKITEASRGKHLLIRYDGQQESRRGGDPMNVYTVFELTPSQWKQWQSVAELPF